MALFQVWADARNPGSDKVLPDVGFETLPHLYNHFMMTDLYVYSWLIISLARVLGTSHRQAAFRRFFWISGTLYLLRSFTITFTILPTPYTGCEPRIHMFPFWSALKIVFGSIATCGDVMYSGHTMMLTSSALIWQLYDRRRSAILLAWSVSFLGMLIIIATHFHYSDDVIIAFIFTLFVHIAYFWGLRIYMLECSFIERLGDERELFVDKIVPFEFFYRTIAILDGASRLRTRNTTIINGCDDLAHESLKLHHAPSTQRMVSPLLSSPPPAVDKQWVYSIDSC